VRVLHRFAAQQRENLLHPIVLDNTRNFRGQPLQLVVAGRFHLNRDGAAFESGWNGQQDFWIELHRAHAPADVVFDPRHAREAQPPDFFLETLELVATSEARVRSDSNQLFAAQDLRDAGAVSDRYLFEPVEQIFEMILSGLERFHEREKRFAVGLIQLQPSFLSLWVKTFEPAIGLNLRIEHFLILQQNQ